MVARVDRTLRNRSVAAGLAGPVWLSSIPAAALALAWLRPFTPFIGTRRRNRAIRRSRCVRSGNPSRGLSALGDPRSKSIRSLAARPAAEARGQPIRRRRRRTRAVYLTNALTGWSPTRDPKQLVLRELQAEREAANKVKPEQRILVILGNPHYDGFPGIAMAGT